MNINTKPLVNPLIVLREEFDDWAILFNPDTGRASGLNPTGVFIWKHFDGKHSIEDIIHAVREKYNNAPPEAGEHITSFIQDLFECDFAN